VQLIWALWDGACLAPTRRMRLRTTLSLGFALIAVACGGTTDASEAAAPADLKASSSHTSDHDAFVCHTDNPADLDSTTMFAFDEKGIVDDKHTRPGYCEIALDSSGKPILSYLCEVTDTDQAETTDGQLALLFTKSLGDGNELLHQYNLPKDLREKKGGKGTMRILSRAPHDLTQPNPSSGVEKVDCKLETVKFPTL
jgi:hypothetical protein